MDPSRLKSRRRALKPAQETTTGFKIPLAQRTDFFALLSRVLASGIPAKAQRARAMRQP